MKAKKKDGFLKWLIHNYVFWFLIILNVIFGLARLFYPELLPTASYKWTDFLGVLVWILIFYIYYLWGDKVQKGFVKGGRILLWISLILFLNTVVSFGISFFTVDLISEKILDILIINAIVSFFILIFTLPIGLVWKFTKN